ncbi:calcium/calmodulin-dependent protein kinase type IV-like [Dysidea avara]|uniref:calcium/calmodulin-dependent protein kinase type IV-like n=1 Tax=Dysidea avara TaxID=196820 RepID=UPI00332F9CD4
MFAYAQKESIEKRYKPLGQLGSGATAVVKKYQHRETGKDYAVKTINKKEIQEKILKREVDILLHLSHDNIIKMHDIYEGTNHLHLVLELVTGGELFDRIVKVGTYSEVVAAKAIQQILQAVQYLHGNGIIHRDLKPENLLYAHPGDDSAIKIADFGMSRMLKPDQVEMMTCCGTPGYVAPEVLLGKMYDGQVDLWAVGVILFIMLGGYEPFAGDDSSDAKIYQRIIKCEYKFDEDYWKDITLSARDVIAKMLVLEPKSRLTAGQCLDHPWVKGLGAKDEHLEKCVTKIREFNARRKLKGGIYGVIGANAMLQAIRKLAQ